MKMLSLFLLVLFSTSAVWADPDDYENMEFENRDYARSIFQELFRGDVKNIKGIYRLDGLESFRVDPLKACKKEPTDIITPDKQATFCRKFLSKEKTCPLNKDFFYVRYSYHERPEPLAPITGGFLISAPMKAFADFKTCKKNEIIDNSIYWNEATSYIPDKKVWGVRSSQGHPHNRFYFQMGKHVEVPHFYLKGWNRQPDYIHLLDVKEIQAGENKRIWIRMADIDSVKPAWFELSEFIKGDTLDIETMKKRRSPSFFGLAALTRGDPIWIRYNRDSMPRVYFAGKELGVGEDKLLVGKHKEEPYSRHDLRSNGIHCFVKIEDGKLYFKMQISHEKAYQKGSEDFSLKRFKEQNQGTDALFYIRLDEYLKENEIRLIEYPLRDNGVLADGEKCQEDSVWMNKSPTGFPADIRKLPGSSSDPDETFHSRTNSFAHPSNILYDRHWD